MEYNSTNQHLAHSIHRFFINAANRAHCDVCLLSILAASGGSDERTAATPMIHLVNFIMAMVSAGKKKPL